MVRKGYQSQDGREHEGTLPKMNCLLLTSVAKDGSRSQKGRRVLEEFCMAGSLLTALSAREQPDCVCPMGEDEPGAAGTAELAGQHSR